MLGRFPSLAGAASAVEWTRAGLVLQQQACGASGEGFPYRGTVGWSSSKRSSHLSGWSSGAPSVYARKPLGFSAPAESSSLMAERDGDARGADGSPHPRADQLTGGRQPYAETGSTTTAVP